MSLYDIEVKSIKGEKQTLAPYKGNVLLIVNTATKCGFAPQFKGLQKLHDSYKEKGFAVLGFPSSQFMNQELEDNAAIEQSCELNFGVNFPLYAKIDVNGKDAHPLFRKLTSEAPGVLGMKRIKWNFTKFLINKDGKVVKRYGPNVTPEKIDQDIRKALES